MLGPIWPELNTFVEVGEIKVGDEASAEVGSGDVILAMGGEALKSLRGEGVVHKTRAADNLRGVSYHRDDDTGLKFLVTHSPSSTVYDYGNQVKIQWDIRLAARLATTGTLDPPRGQYSYVEDLSGIVIAVNQLYEDGAAGYDGDHANPIPVALDLETMGLFPWYDDKHILTSSWTVLEGAADVVYHPVHHSGSTSSHTFYEGELTEVPSGLDATLYSQIRWLLTSPRVSLWGANLKFDLTWIRQKWGIVCTNFRFDTLLAGSLIDENRSNSLATHSQIYTPLGGYDTAFNKKYDKAHMEKVPLPDLLTYAGGDTDACLRAGHAIRQQLFNDEALTNFYVNLLQPAARGMENCEFRGIKVDEAAYLALEIEVKQEIAKLEKYAKALIPQSVKAMQPDKKPLNLGSPKLLRDTLFGPYGWNLTPKAVTEKTQQPSVSMKALKQYEDHPKAGTFIRTLGQLNKAKKTLTTYICKRDAKGKIIGGFLKHLRPDGRWHPTHMLFVGQGGAVTGRISVLDPAVQTIPKHTKWAKPLRRCIVAPPGWLVFNVDYSQGELRLVADVANEITMIKAYANGLDLHEITAAKVAGVPLHEFQDMKTSHPSLYEAMRQGAKAGNFGLLYGMGAAGFQAYARDSYGVNMSLAEATQFRNTFFSLYSGLLPWHNHQRQMAHFHKMVRNRLGRIRHLPLISSSDSGVVSSAERMAINSPIQGGLSDMTLLTIGLWEEQDAQVPEDEKVLKIWSMTHDSCYGVIQDSVEGCKELYRLQHLMAHLPLKERFDWEPKVDFLVDTELGPNLGDLKKVSHDEMAQFAGVAL